MAGETNRIASTVRWDVYFNY